MTSRTWCLLWLLLPAVLSAQGVGVGKRVNLSARLRLNDSTAGQFAQLFVPDYFQPLADGAVLLVLHLHSASWAAADEVYKDRAGSNEIRWTPENLPAGTYIVLLGPCADAQGNPPLRQVCKVALIR